MTLINPQGPQAGRSEVTSVVQHPTIDNVVAVDTGPRQKRVMAVQWGQHDALTCDGNDLDIDTTGFLSCPVSGCRWSYDPESSCPVHVYRTVS